MPQSCEPVTGGKEPIFRGHEAEPPNNPPSAWSHGLPSRGSGSRLWNRLPGLRGNGAPPPAKETFFQGGEPMPGSRELFFQSREPMLRGNGPLPLNKERRPRSMEPPAHPSQPR